MNDKKLTEAELAERWKVDIEIIRRMTRRGHISMGITIKDVVVYFLEDIEEYENNYSETERKRREKQKSRQCYIYIIGAIDLGKLCKIGTTTNVPERLKQLRCSSPFDLFVLKEYEVLDGFKVEKMIHEMLSHKRKQGEWFELNEKNLWAIDNLVKAVNLS